MSEVPLYTLLQIRGTHAPKLLHSGGGLRLQGYLAHKNLPPPRTLQLPYA